MGKWDDFFNALEMIFLWSVEGGQCSSQATVHDVLLPLHPISRILLMGGIIIYIK